MDKMKKNYKIKLRKYYHDLFWRLYNPECMHLGKRWIERIETEKHYSYITMRKICIVLKWFEDNFDTSIYRVSLSTTRNTSIRAFVYRKNVDELIKVAFFESKNGLYIPTSDTENEEYKNIDQCECIL